MGDDDEDGGVDPAPGAASSAGAEGPRRDARGGRPGVDDAAVGADEAAVAPPPFVPSSAGRMPWSCCAREEPPACAPAGPMRVILRRGKGREGRGRDG